MCEQSIRTCPKTSKQGGGGKEKMSVWTVSGTVLLFQSISGSIALLVFGYAFTMDLLGLMWKNRIELQYPVDVDYAIHG